MPEPTTAAPVVDVLVTTDGTAQITVDGVSHELTAADVDNARRRSVAHIASTVATPAGGPVLAKVVDPDGNKVGTVKQVYLDNDNGQPLFMFHRCFHQLFLS